MEWLPVIKTIYHMECKFLWLNFSKSWNWTYIILKVWKRRPWKAVETENSKMFCSFIFIMAKDVKSQAKVVRVGDWKWRMDFGFGTQRLARLFTYNVVLFFTKHRFNSNFNNYKIKIIDSLSIKVRINGIKDLEWCHTQKRKEDCE